MTVRIDGGRGEGGGQILRTSLALSVLTGESLQMVEIRAGRSSPGLAPQHLSTVEAFREIAGATCMGASLGSKELVFTPGPVRPGRYTVDIGTAGSVTLVLQALALPLALAAGPSEVSLRGGTHVPWSPPFTYLEACWLPFLRELGVEIEARLERAGFYPKGGGHVVARCAGGARLQPIRRTERGSLRSLEIVSGSARLPGHIRQRQASRARAGVLSAGMAPSVQLVEVEAASPGSFVAVTGVFEKTRATTSALGARGKRAEEVGDEAGRLFRDYLNAPGALDLHLGDQILLPLALAPGPSEYTTVRITQHLVTQVDVVRAFLDRSIAIEGTLGEPGRVRID